MGSYTHWPSTCTTEVPEQYLDPVLTKSNLDKEELNLGTTFKKEVTLYDCGCIKFINEDVDGYKVDYDCNNCLLGMNLKNLKLNHALNILKGNKS